MDSIEKALSIYPKCADCQRLWLEYVSATRAHFRLDNKLQLAALEHDVAQITSLTPEVESALSLRMELKQGIRDHNIAVHPIIDAATAVSS